MPRNLRHFFAIFALATMVVVSASSLIAVEVVGQGFSPGNAEAVVVAAINSAKKELKVAAYSFTSKPIAKALVEAKRRGVAVSVVLDKSQEGERYTASTFLVNEGVPVRINRKYAIMHNKFMVIDSDTVETGSFNFTSSAAGKNAENVLVIRDVVTAAAYAREWAHLWAESDAPKARTNPAQP